MDVLEVKNLCKRYSAFTLNHVSFQLEEGKITGFIGRNGAGKSTTLKSMFGFVHPDAGEIFFFGKEFGENELEIKQKVGYVSGGVDYYPKKKLKSITAVTKAFYRDWDEKAYRQYMELFGLDENKTPSELSEGMKVKYALTIALSHNAKLLVLDEPTSGLDPISRDELLDIFMELADKRITILFSTHITTDLDRCADNIIYIRNGEIKAEERLSDFVQNYRLVEFIGNGPTEEQKEHLIGCKRSKEGYTALVRAEDAELFVGRLKPADIETIMIHLEKEGDR